MQNGEKLINAASFFLSHFFPDIEGKLLIWEKEGKRSSWFDDIEAAAHYAAARDDVYFGCGLSPQDFGSKKRCPAKKIIAISGLWLDIDFSIENYHAAANLPALEDLEDVDIYFKKIFPFSPTFANFSGGGFHLFWKFKELWLFESDSDRRAASTLSSEFQAYFRNIMQREQQWALDNTSDLSRVLRVPGSFNAKKKKRVEVVTCPEDGSRFFASHFANEFFADDFRDFIEDATLSQTSLFDTTAGAPVTHSVPAAQPVQTDEKSPSTKTQKQRSSFADKPEKKIYQEIKDAAIIADRCAFIAHCIKDAKILPEPHWYALATVCARCLNGSEKFHQWSSVYPKYTKADADAKLVQALEKSGPITCKYVQQNFGAIFCDNCSFKSIVRSPIATALFPEELPDIIVDANATIPFTKFKALCRLEPRLEDSFYRRRRDLKDSRACELSVAHFCVAASWTDQEIANLLVAFHLEAHETIKPPEHYQRIISLAQKGKKRKDAEEVIQAAIELGEKSTEEELSEAISTELGFRVLRFVKFLSEPPVFRIETPVGNVNLGENILSQTLVRQRIYADINVVIPRFSAGHFDRIVEALARIRVEEYVGEEATTVGAVGLWLRRYFERKPPIDDFEDAERERFPFAKNNVLYFFGSDFVRFLYTEFNERISRKELGIFLRQANLEATKIRVSTKVCHVWVVPGQYLNDNEGSEQNDNSNPDSDVV